MYTSIVPLLTCSIHWAIGIAMALSLHSPRLTSTKAIPTPTNSVYRTVRKEREGSERYNIPLGAGEEGEYDIPCPSHPPPPTSQQSLPTLPPCSQSEEVVYEVIPGENKT